MSDTGKIDQIDFIVLTLRELVDPVKQILLIYNLDVRCIALNYR
jgi:hypothetical protein